MAIPRWRRVRYTDDGCNVFQCLSCYHQWEMRSSPRFWFFCPCCGTRWEGEHECRPQDEPRYPGHWQHLRVNRENARFYVIEQRKILHHSDGEEVVKEDWGTFATASCGQGDFEKAFKALKEARENYAAKRAEEIAEEEEYEPEYRIGCFVEKQYRIKIRRRGDFLKQVY